MPPFSEQAEARWPDRVRLPFRFDSNRLAADLAACAGIEWIAHFVKQNYDGDWSVLPLRANASATHPVMMIYSDPMATAYVDTPFLAATPYFREVIAAFQCPVNAVRLMKLSPGSVINEHHDNDLDVELGQARVHVPVVTSDAVRFFLNHSRVEMAAGSCWYLRLSDPHSVENAGTEDRVHLVLDLEVNEWLLDQFAVGLSRA